MSRRKNKTASVGENITAATATVSGEEYFIIQ